MCSELPIRDRHAHKIASEHHALPLFRGRDGYIALALTGEILEFEWRRFDEPMPLFGARGRVYGALVVGATKYPELAQLLPVRQPDDEICEHCGGSGRHPLAIEHKDERVICECGGLGFVSRRLPDGADAPPQPRTNAFPDVIPSIYKTSHFYVIDSENDIRDEAELERLIRTMYADSDAEFLCYWPKDSGRNRLIQDAIDRGMLADAEHEFFYYRREGAADRNFVRIEGNSCDDSHVEILFGYEKRDVLWARAVSAGKMYVRTKLRLNERFERQLEVQNAADLNPIEAKPGLFGFNIDLIKAFRLFTLWLKRRRRE
jgi:hypothetical protein